VFVSFHVQRDKFHVKRIPQLISKLIVVFFLYMARRKLEEREVRKLYKNSGGSIQVTIPIELVRDLKWRAGQKVVVKKRGEGILIEDWKK